MEITTVGIDLAKNVFRLHGCDARGRAVLRKQLGRRQLLAFVALLPRCERRLISLGFLSPRVVEAIAEGRQPPDLTVNCGILAFTNIFLHYLVWTQSRLGIVFSTIPFARHARDRSHVFFNDRGDLPG